MNGDYGEYCLQNKLIPGSFWEITNFGPARESFLISNGESNLSISKAFAEKVKVIVLKNQD